MSDLYHLIGEEKKRGMIDRKTQKSRDENRLREAEQTDAYQVHFVSVR